MQTCLGGGARRIASMAFPTLLSLRGSTLADLRLRLAERLFSHAGRMYAGQPAQYLQWTTAHFNMLCSQHTTPSDSAAASASPYAS